MVSALLSEDDLTKNVALSATDRSLTTNLTPVAAVNNDDKAEIEEPSCVKAGKLANPEADKRS